MAGRLRIDTGAMFLAVGGFRATVFCWGLPADTGLVQAVQQPGARVVLQVDRQQPSRVRIAGTQRSTSGGAAAMTLVFPALGQGLIVGALVMALRRR